MADEAYISIEEVAKRLGVEEKTIGKYVREGRLKAIKNPINGSIVGFTEANIQEFLTGKPVEPKQEVRQPSDLPETLETKRQKELTTQAQLQNEQHKAKIEVELRQKGYDSIGAGLTDAEAKQKDALDQLEMANRERAAVRAELEAVAKEKQKVINALAVVKERERLVNEKWADIMVREENQKAFVGKYEKWREALQELTIYHKSHIEPCIYALKVITKTIYLWADKLNSHTAYDWTRLYNFLGDKAKVMDDYVDHINGTMPKIEMDGKEEHDEDIIPRPDDRGH